MNPITDKQNEDLPIHENLTEDEKEKKAGKSNSELMAEFFAVVSDEDKKE